MSYHVADAGKIEWGERPAAVEGQAPRTYAEITDEAQLKNSRARMWRYPPHTRGRRHADKVQEEVFVVVSGQMTMLLGDPPERVDVGPQSVVAVEPNTPLQVRNESDEDLVVFIYRQDQYVDKSQPPTDAEGIAELIIGKQRNGPTGVIKLAFIREYTRFENLAMGCAP